MFVNRSNVGKSSLINNLFDNNKVVRVSKTPGCTRNVNFYAFVTSKGVKSTYFVDLPGYGYAKASKEDREDWIVMIKKYLMARDLTVLRYDFNAECHLTNKIFIHLHSLIFFLQTCIYIG